MEGGYARHSCSSTLHPTRLRSGVIFGPGDRIIVTGGPWPERIGCTGVVATPPALPMAGEYPWSTTPKHEVIVRLDADPLVLLPYSEKWTCVIGRKDIEEAT